MFVKFVQGITSFEVQKSERIRNVFSHSKISTRLVCKRINILIPEHNEC